MVEKNKSIKLELSSVWKLSDSSCSSHRGEREHSHFGFSYGNQNKRSKSYTSELPNRFLVEINHPLQWTKWRFHTTLKEKENVQVKSYSRNHIIIIIVKQAKRQM